jgi:ferredoxin--NADP+ reductase
MKKVVIKRNSEITAGIFSLTFSRFFSFIPGQVIKVTTNTAIAPRMYSIASGLEDDDIQIIYDVKPEGELTNILMRLSPGDEIMVSLPFGQFTCSDENAWWIATGTGIAPFYSMLRSGRRNGVTLLHGVRKSSHLLFRKEIECLLGENYIRCCSVEEVEDSFHGRVTAFLETQVQLPGNAKFYLCGGAEMVVDVRDILIGKGVLYENIFSEIYF